MPPKPKYSKEEIVLAAYQLASEKGIDSIAAREVGKMLNTSSSPIFTFFKSMDELKEEVWKLGAKNCIAYLQQAMNYKPMYKELGKCFITFATEYPNVFKFVFNKVSYEASSLEEILQTLGEPVEICIENIMHDYNLTKEEANIVFKHNYVFIFGIAMLCADKVCAFTDEEIYAMLTRQYLGTYLCELKMKDKE